MDRRDNLNAPTKLKKNKAAMSEWNRIKPLLIDLGLFNELDKQLLATYCLAIAYANEASSILDEEGLIIEGDRGLVKHPANQVMRDYSTLAAALAEKLGMTQISRIKLNAKHKPKSGEGTSLFNDN